MSHYRWDHSVHYVTDLNTAIQSFGEVGLRAFHGGSHQQWGTHNALSYFGLTYHEFLAIEQRQTAELVDPDLSVIRDAVTLLPEHPVLSRVVLRTDNINQAADHLHAQGIHTSAIIPGKRHTQNGQLIQWQMLMLHGDFQGLSYPFVIQWQEIDAEREHSLRVGGALEPHPLGDAVIQQAIFTVPDPEQTAQHWHTLFGFPVQNADDGVALLVQQQRFIFQSGKQSEFTAIDIGTSATHLLGKSIAIGQGEYRFRSLLG